MEKHLPVVEIDGSTVKVAVGSIPHPMEDNHYIEWIELVTDSRTYRKFLTPGSAPEVEFTTTCRVREVRSYCNIHGLWSTKL
jgi:superoxide reductase